MQLWMTISEKDEDEGTSEHCNDDLEWQPGVLCVCLADGMQGTISLIPLSLVINRWDTGARLGKSSESQPDVDIMALWA